MLKFAKRQGTKSLKYDALGERFGRESLLPLWVADMDCCAPETVRQAIQQRVDHGIYGYSDRRLADNSKAAICSWLETRHEVQDLQLQDCRMYAGVMEALAVCIEVLCPKTEAVILNSPAYNCFYTALEASGRKILENYLAHDGKENYSIDLGLLEQQILDSPIKPRILLFCSPHNPVGKVWKERDIYELIRICQKYDLYLISDEIHSDLVYPGHKHLSILRQEFANLYDKIIMISAPSKTFNIPGLRSAYLISKNKTILQQLGKFCEQFQIGDISLSGHLALEACYSQEQSKVWLEELKQYLKQNRDLLHDYLKERFPELKHCKPEATYLYWVNCRSFLQGNPAALRKFFMDAGLALGWGELYHGNGWVRINFGCERALLEEALDKWNQAYLNLR
ncbi:PatB family C-S lyase [Candidatus Haliotispira prima]|uniref:cysteine-S-conjugate beta-lyase n=1 Tax=Candidatus Haliotispira prima TaxID=3034016 RepID=A0ABY8MIL6_9SPIO|nr:PatB family C-S lyase [Candidatus Haliotispira prima]